MTDSPLHIPSEWEALDPERLNGTILVIGASDRGKSTLVRWLVERLLHRRQKVGWLDGDIGQSTLGVPSTMNLAVMEEFEKITRPQWTFFVGATSPRGHMLPTLVGVALLKELAMMEGALAIVVDTTGFVAEEAGGGALKEWKIELLRPAAVIALQRGGELEHILPRLRRDRRFVLHEMPVSEAVEARGPQARAERRRTLFRRYFQKAGKLNFGRKDVPIYGIERSCPGRLLAFNDERGLTLALGTVIARGPRGLEILTPLADPAAVAALRLGTILLDPETGEEFR